MKIHPVRAKLFYADGKMEGGTKRQADMTKFRETFCNFANMLKTVIIKG